MTLADPNNPNSTGGNALMSGDTSIYEGQGSGKQDTFARDFMKHMLMTGIMSNPKARQGYGMAKMFRDQGPMGLAKGFGQRAGIEALFNKVGPWGMLLQNKGGPLGLGIMDSKRPMSSKVTQLLLDPRVAGRMKFAKFFPGIAALGWGLNKLSPRIEGQRGALGQGLGPQFANLASKMFGTRTHEQAMEEFGPGIMGGTLGPRIRNLLGLGGREDESPIQEIEVTAQRREEQPEESVGEDYSPSAMSMRMSDDQLFSDLAASGLGSDKLSGLAPGVAQSTNQGLRATNIGNMLAKRAAARALTGKEAKYDRSGLNRFISSGGGRK